MPPRSSVFCTRARNGWCFATADLGSKQLALLLREHGVETFVSHSSLGVDERRPPKQAFAQRQNCVIVATSSLELGLDVGDLDRVIQIDAPPRFRRSSSEWAARDGGRTATRIACGWQRLMKGCYGAAALLGLWQEGFVEPVYPPEKPYHILAQQLMALILQERGIGQSSGSAGSMRSRRFGRWTPAAVTALVESMLGCQDCLERQRHSFLRPRGRGEFRSQELQWGTLSVFTSAPLFRVMCGKKELGSVHESTFFTEHNGPDGPSSRRALADNSPGLAAAGYAHI